MEYSLYWSLLSIVSQRSYYMSETEFNIAFLK